MSPGCLSGTLKNGKYDFEQTTLILRASVPLFI